jgi:hypothetical protein
MSHRLPEVHSTKCADQKKSSSQSSFKVDAGLAQSLYNREGGSKKTLAKEKADAKERLKKKIETARKKK